MYKKSKSSNHFENIALFLSAPMIFVKPCLAYFGFRFIVLYKKQRKYFDYSLLYSTFAKSLKKEKPLN